MAAIEIHPRNLVKSRVSHRAANAPSSRFDGLSNDCYDRCAGWSSLVARWAHNPKVGGSNPPPATNFKGSGPDTWVTKCTGYMGNTFGPKGFSSGSKTLVSKSK
jgi:hypothetical protein